MSELRVVNLLSGQKLLLLPTGGDSEQGGGEQSVEALLVRVPEGCSWASCGIPVLGSRGRAQGTVLPPLL